MPVRTRNGASSLVQLGDHVELFAQPLGDSPFATVSRGE